MPQAATEKNIPQLVIPPPAVARHPETIVHIKELQEWLADLPLADPENLVNALYKQLKLLIRDPRPNNKYAELVNAYHPAINHIQSLVWRYLRQPKKHKMSPRLRATIAQLLLELACGHMRLINQDIIQGKSPKADNLYHAIVPMVRLIQWDILQYKLTRPAIWRQILHVFAITELYQVGGDHIESQLKLDSDPEDTHGVFFSLLALLLSDPYRLPDAQQHVLISGLGQFSDHLYANHNDETPHHILLDFSGLQPPLSLARQQLAPKKLRYLQLNDFLQQVEQQGFNNDENNTVSHWLLSSLRALTKLKSASEGRLSSRHAQLADFHFLQGLSQVHNRLQERQPGHHNSDNQQTGIYLDEEDDDISPMLGTPCRQIEQSSTGLSFVIHDKQHVPKVGDWLILEASPQFNQQHTDYLVVQIRRRLQREDSSDEIGVEKLRGSVIPVILGLNANIGLLNIDEASNTFQLITNQGNFLAGQEQSLHSEQGNFAIRYEQLLESGNNSERIRITLV